jgi:Na+/H+ antiporter NhaD/arsenite permease-like protein
MLTPLVLEVVVGLRRNPVPYLLAVAMSSTRQSRPISMPIAGKSSISC